MLELIDKSWSKKNPSHSSLKWKQQHEVEKHSFSFFNINKTHYEHPSSKKSYPFYRFNTKDWVGIFALDKDKNLIVIEQYRFGTDEITLEVPGGVIEGNSIKKSALRELQEETGYVCDDPIFLGSLSTNSALMNNHIHFFYGKNAIKKYNLNLDKTESIKTKIIKVEDFDDLVNQGAVNHALIVGGFLLFKNKIWKQHE